MLVRTFRVVSLSLALLAADPVLAAPGAPAKGGSARVEAEKAAIARVIRTSIEWALTKDTRALYDCCARDSSFFIFHPDSKSTITGFDAFRAMCERVFMDPRFKATDSRFKDLRIHLSRSGDVAWYSCLLDDHGTWDGRPSGWDDARWTGVLEKRGGRWVIAQMHFSLASDKVAAEAAAKAGAFPALAGPYLGQPAPGAEPTLFAPGVVCSGMNERDVAISPDGREIYFGVMAPPLVTIMWTRLVNGRWTEPEVAPFAADTRYFHFEPCLSADGRRMLFLTTRPTAGEKDRPGWGNQNIFAADRRADGTWGEPYDLGAPVNTTDNEFFPSLTRDGTLYFTKARARGGRFVIVRSRLAGGRYQPPDTLPAAVNGRGTPYNAFVAPDESYLVACVDERADLTPPGPRYMVFFRRPDGAWSEGVDLAARVPMRNGNAGSPYVSPDGRYFFFGSSQAGGTPAGEGKPLTVGALRQAQGRPGNGGMDIYWMDASFLEALRPAPRK